MKNYTYIGLFKSDEGYEYELQVHCNGFLQAFFLLTTDAIRSAKHYQLYSIKDEKGEVQLIDDIHKIIPIIFI